MQSKKNILPVIVIAQFFCTSIWFASNAVMNDLVATFTFNDSAVGHLSSAVQFGFITGTLVFAILTIADRYSPSRVFFISALLAACFNLGIIWEGNTLTSMLSLRFLTGFFLAGIYPIGMKIAADHYEKKLGKSLGFLVGALVLGTALPHLLKGITSLFPWKSVFLATSSLSVLGGSLLLLLVPDGPYRKPSQRLDLGAFFSVFKDTNFRAAAFGYFGHMWELYAFWVFTPILLTSYESLYPSVDFNIPVLSFFIIGVGGLACILSGYLSQTIGTKRTAFMALLLSGGCCLLSPFMFAIEMDNVFVAFLIFWGMVVVADSPLFSTLVAQNAPSEIKGTALTIVNCIGFAITIPSIQLLTSLRHWTDSTSIYAILAIGPILGLIALSANSKTLA